MTIDKTIENLIIKYRDSFAGIFPFKINSDTVFTLDLGPENNDLKGLEITNNEVLESYIRMQVDRHGTKIPVGGYNEKRVLYNLSKHFGDGSEKRDIHLGTDIWIPAGTTIKAPMHSSVHSYAINNNYRDYGPTIILQHKLDDQTFYTLYGHLSAESMDDLYEGKTIKKGEGFASVGGSDVNGSWPPHLHFQVICDMGDMKGDFPGVTSIGDRDKYLEICPDPAYILGLK